MKIDSPKSVQPQEKGDLLYDLVLAQQQDEEEIRDALYQNQTLEGYEGSNMEFKNCTFRGCQFVDCRMSNFSFVDVVMENCNLSGCEPHDLACQRVRLRGC